MKRRPTQLSEENNDTIEKKVKITSEITEIESNEYLAPEMTEIESNEYLAPEMTEIECITLLKNAPTNLEEFRKLIKTIENETTVDKKPLVARINAEMFSPDNCALIVLAQATSLSENPMEFCEELVNKMNTETFTDKALELITHDQEYYELIFETLQDSPQLLSKLTENELKQIILARFSDNAIEKFVVSENFKDKFSSLPSREGYNEFLSELSENESKEMIKKEFTNYAFAGFVVSPELQKKFNSENIKDIMLQMMKYTTSPFVNIIKAEPNILIQNLNHQDYKKIVSEAIKSEEDLTSTITIALDHEDTTITPERLELILAAVKSDKINLNTNPYTNPYATPIGLLSEKYIKQLDPAACKKIALTIVEKNQKVISNLLEIKKIINKITSKDFVEIASKLVEKGQDVISLLTRCNTITKKITPKDFVEIASKLVEKDQNVISLLNKYSLFTDKLTKEDCLNAVEKNPAALKLFALDKFQDENYYDISMQAITKNPLAAKYLERDKLTEEQHSYLQTAASNVAKQKFNLGLLEDISITNKSTTDCKFLNTESQQNNDLTQIPENQIYE